MTEIFMPKAGMDMKEGRLIRWLKEVGDPVEKDEPIMEIETDKITMEAEAPGSGILLAKTVEEDTWVPVLSVIGYIGEKGEKVPEAPASAAEASSPALQPAAQGGEKEKSEAAPQAEISCETPAPAAFLRGASEPGSLTAPMTEKGQASRNPAVSEPDGNLGLEEKTAAAFFSGPILATPYAKKTAQDKGVDLKDVISSRSDGIIRAADVLATPLARRIAQDQGVDLSSISGTGHHGKVTKDDVLAASQACVSSAATQSMKADVTGLLKLLSQLNESREEKLSLDAFFLKAAALAVRKLSLRPAVSLSFAVFDGGEKQQPAVAGAETLSLSQISAQIGELTQKALSHALPSQGTDPAAFGICNMSSFGLYAFTPVLRPGETGIFGLAGAEDTLALENSQVVAHKTAMVCLRYNAQTLTEFQAAQLLGAVKALLETPMEILL